MHLSVDPYKILKHLSQVFWSRSFSAPSWRDCISILWPTNPRPSTNSESEMIRCNEVRCCSGRSATPPILKTRQSRPIRCDVWIVERMRYPTNRPTDRPTDTASYKGALSHLKRYATVSNRRVTLLFHGNQLLWLTKPYKTRFPPLQSHSSVKVKDYLGRKRVEEPDGGKGGSLGTKSH